MKILTILVIFLTFFSLNTQAQKEGEKIFVDRFLKETKKIQAEFYRIKIKKGNLYLVSYYARDQEALLMTVTVSPGTTEVKNGEFKCFYRNGALRLSGNYVDGIQDGKWNFYDYKGKLTLTKIFDGTEKQKEYYPL